MLVFNRRFLPEILFLLPTNFTNFRASECRAEFIRAMPSAAENVKKFTQIFLSSLLMATWSVALITRIFAQVSAIKFYLNCRAQPKMSNNMIE